MKQNWIGWSVYPEQLLEIKYSNIWWRWKSSEKLLRTAGCCDGPGGEQKSAFFRSSPRFPCTHTYEEAEGSDNSFLNPWPNSANRIPIRTNTQCGHFFWPLVSTAPSTLFLYCSSATIYNHLLRLFVSLFRRFAFALCFVSGYKTGRNLRYYSSPCLLADHSEVFINFTRFL